MNEERSGCCRRWGLTLKFFSPTCLFCYSKNPLKYTAKIMKDSKVSIKFVSQNENGSYLKYNEVWAVFHDSMLTKWNPLAWTITYHTPFDKVI